MATAFNRAAEDIGNIVGLEHVNLAVADQQIATRFYVSALGLTRDPYLMTGTSNMWVNVGRSQFHLPTSKPQVLRGHVGLVLPDRKALLERLARQRKHLEGTRFDFREADTYVEATCPWGNRIRCYDEEPRFKRIQLGMIYLELEVPRGSADGIMRFYRDVMGTLAAVDERDDGHRARVAVGNGQHLLFRETDQPMPDYDGHHIQIYVGDFSGPYRRLLERKLICEESDQHQYRFKDIVDPESGKLLYTIEHEVRSMRHPLYMRPLVNRNPAQNNMNYAPGRDAWN